MESKVFVIFTEPDGKLAQESKEEFRKQFAELPHGETFQVVIEPYKPKRFTATRYKYYFDCVLLLAFPRVRERFMLIDKNGEVKNPSSTEELHYCLKLIYNPVTVIDSKSGKSQVIGATTTDLSDNEFINEFMEQIIADFSQEPYYAYGDTGCPTRKEWAEMHKKGEWYGFKDSFCS